MLAFDVVIVGGGGAGLRAAIAAAQSGGCSVALLAKSHPLRSTTACTGGGINAVQDQASNSELELYIRDTIVGGDYLNDQAAVEWFTAQTAGAISELDCFGTPFLRDEAGGIARSLGGGATAPRLCWTFGHSIAHSLYEQYLRYPIYDLSNACLLQLAVKDGNLQGLIAFDIATGKAFPIIAKAVVMATGGAGRIFWRRTTNPVDCTGDGLSACLEAGIALKDPEFVQFHPTALAASGILLSEGARTFGGYLLNRNGERFMVHYEPQMMEMATRDAVAAAIEAEIRAGRGYGHGDGAYVMLDLRHLDRNLLQQRLKQICDAAVKFEGLDPVKDLLPVRPACHYMMGGIDVLDYRTCATAIAGVFAAGECACVSVQGANRLGGNALSEIVVFGKAAGAAAAEHARASGVAFAAGLGLLAESWQQRFDELRRKPGGAVLAEIRNRLGSVMWDNVGMSRNLQGLQNALTVIAELKQEYESASLGDSCQQGNLAFVNYIETGSMLNVAHAVTLAALARRESRGCHQRSDFPARDDASYLRHSIISKPAGQFQINYRPVSLGTCLPEGRKTGE